MTQSDLRRCYLIDSTLTYSTNFWFESARKNIIHFHHFLAPISLSTLAVSMLASSDNFSEKQDLIPYQGIEFLDRSICPALPQVSLLQVGRLNLGSAKYREIVGGGNES